MQSSIGAFEAKTHFAQIIQRAMQGEEIFITRRGKTVAKIVSADSSHDLDSAKAAAQRLRSLAKEMQLGPFLWEEWKAYRDVGRS
jgi:prevent-host-death family protein